MTGTGEIDSEAEDDKVDDGGRGTCWSSDVCWSFRIAARCCQMLVADGRELELAGALKEASWLRGVVGLSIVVDGLTSDVRGGDVLARSSGSVTRGNDVSDVSVVFADE